MAVGISSYVILALDAEAHTRLKSLGVPAYDATGDLERASVLFNIPARMAKAKSKRQFRLGQVWAVRYMLIRAALGAGVQVLQSDVDAVLLRDPMPELAATAGDVVAQKGKFPRRQAQRWGATLCFGFILYRPTVATLAWFDMALPLFYQLLDDQAAFQLALSRCTNLVWNGGGAKPAGIPQPGEHVSALLNITDSAATTTPMAPGGRPLTVALLAFLRAPRKCGEEFGFPEKGKGVFLLHCYATKSGSSKSKAAAKFGFSFLRPDWLKQAPLPSETADAFLRRLGAHPLLCARHADRPPYCPPSA